MGIVRWRTNTLHSKHKLLNKINKELQFANEKIESSLLEKTILVNEKETLIKEIHHRVKNNMQIIISLIRLQSQSIKNDDVLSVFKALEYKIQSMGMVHHVLYQSNDLEFINSKEYIENLLEGLRHSISPKSSIQLIGEIDMVMLDIDTAVPLGLIITELITNSFKHAFNNVKNGEINVHFSQNNETLKLEVSDNGTGIKSVDKSSPNIGIGLELVNDLVIQINGIMSTKNNLGVAYTIIID